MANGGYGLILFGDCLDRMKDLADCSVDAVVTDPPYGWRFMGKAWDGADIEKTFSRDKTPDDDKTTLGMASGKYNQSLEANHAFEAFSREWAKEAFRVLKPGGHMLVFCGPRTYHRMASGVEDAGFEIRDQLQWLFGSGFPKSHNLGGGIGSALKPANEPIVLARKPLSEKTLKANHERWGCGGLNIDESRISTSESLSSGRHITGDQQGPSGYKTTNRTEYKQNAQGRWPTNLLLDEESASLLGDQSRFFYCPKSSKSERNAGLGDDQCTHPTVKPIRLMEYLIKLITPPGGTVLDPFMGSGTTGCAAKRLGHEFIGIELNQEYVEIAKRRISV